MKEAKFSQKPLFLLHILLLFTPFSSPQSDRDFVLSTIKNDGYAVKVHNVETPDGYILQLLRICKSGKRLVNQARVSKGVVFMMHGLVSSSGGYIAAGPGQSLAYELVDRDYDVWLGNARGTRFGMKHKSLSVEDDRFWDFRFVELD